MKNKTIETTAGNDFAGRLEEMGDYENSPWANVVLIVLGLLVVIAFGCVMYSNLTGPHGPPAKTEPQPRIQK